MKTMDRTIAAGVICMNLVKVLQWPGSLGNRREPAASLEEVPT